MKADKSLGQHFLVNAGVVARIADHVANAAGAGGYAVEIGPGPGALTGALLERGLHVVAVELDPRMIEHLETRFAEFRDAGKFAVIHADALKVALGDLQALCKNQRPVVCGNLPYNVGSQIVFRFLEEAAWADAFVYMLQKEVVLKFITSSRDAGERRDYGPPGVKLNWTCDVQGHFWVSPGSFDPPPKVDSGVFWFRRKAGGLNPLERGGEYDQAADRLERAFRHRRKMLRGAFPELKEHPWGARRAEELTPDELKSLGAALKGDRS